LGKKEEHLSHELVPPHKILSEADRKKVLQNFGISEAHLPRILATDPALIGLSPKSGDIVQITRKGPTGDHEYYRLVVKG
jgi:DNA-directed RNA polymerase subunit H